MHYDGYMVSSKPKEGESLADLFPDVASQWHPTLNGDLKPSEVVAGSQKRVWWKCDKGPDHEWETTVVKRTTYGRGCGFCANQKASVSNSLASLFPEIASEWHPTKNGDLTPDQIVYGSGKRVWWKCDKGPDHEWVASVRERAKGYRCTCCSGRKVSVTNSLTSLHPELALEWHPTKNGDLTPDQVVAGSPKKVWWKCDKGPDHEWKASSQSRRGENPTGCPACAGHMVSVTNSLASIKPELAKQWHPTLNGDLKPSEVVAGSARKYWWKCEIGPDHKWRATTSSRTMLGAGCPFCTLTPRSAQEIRLANELSALINFDLETHKIRIKGRARDVDIVLEDLGIVVEFDGAYWHRNKADKDLEKAQKLEAEGWNVIRVRERPLDSIHKNDVMVETLAPVKEVADLVLQKIVEVTGVKIPKLKEYLASDEPWREKEALVAIREYQAENARKKAERDAKRKAKKKS